MGVGQLMGEIPEHIWEIARGLRNAVNWQSNSSVEVIALALVKAEQRGKEEAAIRGERAKGDTVEEMRANVSAELTNLGDTVLAWVNEGDLIMSELFASAIRGS